MSVLGDGPLVYIGIDPGAANTGFVSLDELGGVIHARHVKVKQPFKSVIGDFVRATSLRDSLLAALNATFYVRPPCCGAVVCVEGPSFGRMAKGSIETGMAHLAVYDAVHTFFNGYTIADGVVVLAVPPQTLKCFAGCKGTADKPQTRKAIQKQWPIVLRDEFSSQDTVEAYALAQFGRTAVADTNERAGKASYVIFDSLGVVEVTLGSVRRGNVGLHLDDDTVD